MKEIKLKSQPIWVVRSFILAWVVLWGVFAFVSHPIGWTNAQSVNTTVTPLTGEIVSYTLNEDSNTVFTAWILEISWDDKKIFILDRNLWATTTWDLTSALPTSYWYYFQWWNNYWFSPMSNIITWSQKIDCSWYGPNNPLYNNVLIYGYYGSSDYCLSWNDNLWWNTTNTNEARRWPCPENFHIPTSEEVNIIRYNSFNGLPVLIPLAGYMSSYNGSVRLAGMHYYLWSSSPGDYSVHNLGSEPADIYRTSALPIRCVYNFYDTYTAPASSPCPAGQYLATWDVCVTNDLDIVLQATATEANQTLKINKYFANAYTVDRWDGTTGALTADTVHTYDAEWTYDIILSLAWWVDRWKFQKVYKPLVPKAWTTITWVQITYMPSLADWFGNNETVPGDYFFMSFNNAWTLTSLPDWSFGMSSIIAVWNNFFENFNYNWTLTWLPDWSFDMSNITTVWNNFFDYFNNNWALTELPDWSFDTRNITTAWDNFFNYFNSNWALTELPDWSFDIRNITTIWDNFFNRFNSNWALTELPDWSFDIRNITTVGDYFFSSFNNGWSLTSLPAWSFDTSQITVVGNYFFYYFNNEWSLTSLPEWSFRLSTWLSVVGNYFFRAFNYSWRIITLPTWSFNTSNITTVGNYFFRSFNGEWALTSLPEWSFDTSNITTVGDYFFSNFNYIWGLTSLPEWSFDTTSITTVWNNFFDGFNTSWALTSLPNSFNLNSVAYNKTNWYMNAFNSPDYTLNKNVFDLVSWVTAPNSDRNTFSDNQSWRCGVHPNWLISTADACHIIYDANGWVWSVTWSYVSNTTNIVAWSSISVPIRNWYVFNGWYTDPEWWELVENVVFPSMNGDTLYAHWEIGQTVTFDANWWTTSQTTQTVAENTSINLPNASRNGYEFLWWYTEEMGWTRVWWYNDPYTVSQDIILYAHWIEALPEGIFFQTWDITYTDTNWKVFTWIGTITIRSWGKTITILDRNLWATTNDISDIWSHWYYFQWWNNYWFSLDEDFQISSTAIEATDYSWNNPYVSGNFIATNYRDISYNSELWWWADDYDNGRWKDTSNDGYTRQWPCPAWYHVPSIWEFDELMRITKSITWWTVQLQTNDNGNLVESNPFAAAFMSELHFPIAWYIWWDWVYTWISEEGYSYSYFWSSSFRKANWYLMINHHPAASKKDKVSTRGNNFQQWNAFSIRCFKNTAEEWREIVLSYDTRDGSAIQAQTLPVWWTWYLPWYSTHREDAEFLWWYDKDLLVEFNLESTVLNEDTIIYAKWSDDYMVQFLDFDWSVLKTEIVRSGASAIAPVNPVRNWYTFKWRDLDFSNVTWDMVVIAQYSRNPSSWNWWWTQLKKDRCPNWDYSDSYYDGDCGVNPNDKEEKKDDNEKQHNSSEKLVYDTLVFNPHYSDEQNKAYQYAYHYWITTKAPISNANIDWNLTRIAMAKMLSQYAINVLWMKPDKNRNNQFKDVSDKLDWEYDDWVTLAYQLWIMWINMPNNEFRPNDLVPRAEFVTALSRLLYKTPDWIFEETPRYYTPHMEKLIYEWIINNPDPKMLELRWYVMIMLMRSDKIINNKQLRIKNG